MKYQTNAVGHRVGASELPTRHPRHKPRRRFPLLILLHSSKLLQEISPCSFSLSRSLSLHLYRSSSSSSIADASTFPLLLLSSSFSSSFSSTSYISLPHLSTSSFLLFFFPCPIEQSLHFFLMFCSLRLKITSLKTPGCLSATSRPILYASNVDFVVMEKFYPPRITELGFV